MSIAGHVLLVLVIASGLFAVAAGARGRGAWTRGALAIAGFASLAATTLLGRAFLQTDYRFLTVVENSRRAAAGPYRLAGLWAGMAGSLLFWLSVVSVVGLGAAVATRRLPRAELVAAAFGGVVAAVAIISLFLADPFEMLAAPAVDGRGMAPILEHPAMLYHPPLLYLGQALTLVPWALALSGVTASRPRLLRVWLLLPWCLLTLAMLVGAHWAYAELGWGGFWAWDPVENASLLPWLGLTLALHVTRHPSAPVMSDVAIVGSGALAVLGSLLTRSGATSSVHAFAEARAVGWALLGLLVGVVVAGFAGVRHGRAVAEEQACGGRDDLTGSSSGIALWINIHVLVVGLALAVVLLGTLAPLWSDLTGGNGIAIEPWFFAAFVAPLALAATAAGGLALARHRLGGAVFWGGAGALVAAGLAIASGWRTLFGLGAAAACGAGIVAVSRAAADRRQLGASAAHLGIAVLLIGLAGTSTGEDASATLLPGEQLPIGPYELRNVAVHTEERAGDAAAVVATITLVRDGEVVDELQPELVAYPAREVRLAETALRSTLVDDVQVALRQADDQGRMLIEAHWRPLAVWVWIGGLLLVLSGLLALVKRTPSTRIHRYRQSRLSCATTSATV